MRAVEWRWAVAGSILWTLALVAIPPTPFAGLDFSRFCEPAMQFFRTSLLSGEMPWWNPYSSLGRPFVADMQTASFYPTTYLSVFLGIRAGWIVATMAHGVLAIWGFTRLMRWIGVARSAAWVGAVVFLFSAPLLARMQAGQVPYVYALCYLPLVLWLAGLLATAPTRRHWAALALAWGLQFLCSHPQVSWLSALGAGAFATGLLLQPPWGAAFKSWLRAAVALVTACGAGLALLGFIVVPFIELIGQSNRALPSLAFSSMFAMTSAHWMSLVAAPSSYFAINWEYSLYASVVALTGGLVALTRWRDPAMRGLVLMAAAGLVIAAGNATPIFAVLFKTMPGLSNFRIPARAGVLVMSGLIMGATALAGRNPPGQRVRGSVIFAGLLIAAVIAGFFMLRMPAGSREASWLVRQLILVSAATAGWWLWLGRAPGQSTAVTWLRRLLLPGTLVAELCLAVPGLKHLPALPTQFPVEPIVVAAIHAHGLDRQVAPVRVCLPPTMVRENSGMIHRFATITGFESLSLSRVWNYLHEAAGAKANHPYNTSPAGEVYDHAGRFGSVNLSVTLPADSGVLAINPAPDPRAYLATRITRVADAETAVARMVAGHPFHEDALVESPWVERLTIGPPSAGKSAAVITRFGLNSLEISVDSPGAALLVVAEAWYPGWHASIAGRPVECLPVNGWMRGVPVPAGHSIVQLHYAQNGLLPGIFVSLAAAMVLFWASRSSPAVKSHLATDAPTERS